MGNKLNALIEENDWQGVCRILRKQVILWGVLFVLVSATLVIRLIGFSNSYAHLVVFAIVGFRFFKLVKLYRTSYGNMKYFEAQNEASQQIPIEDLLAECKVTKIDSGMSLNDIKQMWVDAYERGKYEGTYPVLLEINNIFYDYLDINAEGDIAKEEEWRTMALNSNYDNGQEILRKRFEEVKAEFSQDGDWENDVVGVDENVDGLNDIEIIDKDLLYLVEMPIKEPWQVFVYIPLGGWNECPSADEHLAIAKYWYKKYGAKVVHITHDLMEFQLPKPAEGDTMLLAEEHMGYCPDTVFQGTNLKTLASKLKKSTIWGFWWD